MRFRRTRTTSATSSPKCGPKLRWLSDVHLHSLRHFHATQIDSVISEAQKQVRLGWSTVQMARHYTDGVAEEDRRAADHIGLLCSNSEANEEGVRSRLTRSPGSSGQLRGRRPLRTQPFNQSFDSPARDSDTATDVEDGKGEGPAFNAR